MSTIVDVRHLKVKARMIRLVGHAERMRVKRTAYGVLFGKPERKRLF